MIKLTCKIIVFSFYMFSTCIFAATEDHLTLDLNKVAEDARRIYSLPALSITVRLPSNQLIQINQGSASKEYIQKINENTLFQVGSTTKTFTAVLVLKLAALHKLNLNDPLGKWLPEYSKWSKITVLQLLNHTSGIYDYIDTPGWWLRLRVDRPQIWSASDLIALSYSHPLYFPTGEGWHYSNTDYVLLGLIVEKAAQMPFKNALTKYIFTNSPVRLKNTYYVTGILPPKLKQVLAHGYRNNNLDETNLNTSWLQASGSMISNSYDLTNWYWEIFSKKIVTETMIKQITTFVSLENGKSIKNETITGYGLGVFSMDTPYGIVWFTPGLTSGYITLVAWLPCKRIAFSYTTNNPPAIGLHVFLINKILSALSNEGKSQCLNEPKSSRVNFPNF